jgi:hypothetical protein
MFEERSLLLLISGIAKIGKILETTLDRRRDGDKWVWSKVISVAKILYVRECFEVEDFSISRASSVGNIVTRPVL